MRRSRDALMMMATKESAMAAAGIIGESVTPKVQQSFGAFRRDLNRRLIWETPSTQWWEGHEWS